MGGIAPVPKCGRNWEKTVRRIWSNNDASCNSSSSVRNDPQGRSHQFLGFFIHLYLSLLKNCTSNCPPVVDVLVQPPYYDNYPNIVGLVKTARWNTSADPDSPYTIEILTYVAMTWTFTNL